MIHQTISVYSTSLQTREYGFCTAELFHVQVPFHFYTKKREENLQRDIFDELFFCATVQESVQLTIFLYLLKLLSICCDFLGVLLKIFCQKSENCSPHAQ